jgi:P-type Ca2+ transporter type 2C
VSVPNAAMGKPGAAGRNWYACPPDDVAAALGVDPATGLTAARVGELLARDGPNALPIAFTSFALCLIVAAVECRSETGTVLTSATFGSKRMNWAMLGEFVLAVLVTQMDVFHRLLGTTQLNLRQFGWALVPALTLLALWELGNPSATTG